MTKDKQVEDGFTAKEIEMAGKGYVYMRDPKMVRKGLRAICYDLRGVTRDELIIDETAYDCHQSMKS